MTGQKHEQPGDRVRKYPMFELSHGDMLHVLRRTYASVQLEAGESIMSLPE